MRRHLNLPQRVVIVVGWGAALYFVGLWTTSLGSYGDTGWVGYAPLSKSFSIPSFGGLHSWVRLVIWLVFVLVWTITSLALLKDSSQRDVEP